ncbi:MAG: VOC family protein [Actinobacteria bacterium]|nr:VOC family protein [Actinomycetota bacterium]
MPNPVMHFEIIHKDAKQLQSFYADVFGWKIDASNPMDYGIVDTGEGAGGGIGGVPYPNYPGHLTFYVQVEDLQATLDHIEKLGGKTVMPPDEVPGGPTIAQFTDPSGHLIGLTKA